MMRALLLCFAAVLVWTGPARAEDPRFAEPTPFSPADDAVADPQAWTGPTASEPLLELSWGGKVQTELHYRAEEKTAGSWYDRQTLPQHFARNENKLNLRLNAHGQRFNAVADLDFDWVGIIETPAVLEELTGYPTVAPYRLQAHALYLEIADLMTPGLDLRIGQQLVQWGVGDQFNPTNNLNPNDLENVLFFGRQVANQMVRLDYAFAESFTLSGVVVPVFKPAVLPASAPLAVTAVDRTPFIEEDLRYRVAVDREFGARLGYPTMVNAARAELPKATIQNMQWEARAAGTVGGHDVALSYYYGRADLPVAVKNYVTQEVGEVCNPSKPTDCADGLLMNEVILRYPRIQVLGLNLSGEINPFGFMSSAVKPFGYRVEVGLYLPRRQHFIVEQHDIVVLGNSRDGEYDYDGDGSPGGPRPTALPSTPFAKWVVGLDYTFGRHVYANAMWVHGMPDELGAGDFISEGWSVRQAGVAERAPVEACALNAIGGDPKAGERCAIEKLRRRLGDYAVVGVDFKFLEERLLVRLFTIWDLGGIYVTEWDEEQQARVETHESLWTKNGFSAVIYPEVDYNFGGGLTLSLGALLQLGEPHTKFGDPASGGSLIWTRATYAY